jgi:acetylserotonin N-methyltransferase
VELIAADLFRDPLPPADLYVLAKVLHNCAPEQIRPLLSRIHAALPAGGGLLAAERLLDDDRQGPRNALLSSLNMLMATKGRERTFAEYRALLLEAGFREVEGKKTGNLLDAILALK